jgi:hypothetical protein
MHRDDTAFALALGGSCWAPRPSLPKGIARLVQDPTNRTGSDSGQAFAP